MEFRRAQPSDARHIVALVESAYRGEQAKLGWTTESDLLDGQRTDVASVDALIQAPQSQIVLAHEQGVLVGCAHIQLHSDGCHFGMFSVNPALQGSGVGKALLHYCEKLAVRDFSAVCMRMWVLWMRESLMAFYLRRGYSHTGEREEFPYGDARFGLPKRADLYFMVIEKKLEA